MLKLLTLGLLGVWWLVDIVLLCLGRPVDGEGRPLQETSRRDPTVLLYLSVFTGMLGFDRFYAGHRAQGFMKMLTLGLLGVWWLLDIYLVLSKSMRPGDITLTLEEGEPRQSIAIFFAMSTGWLGLDRHYLGYRTMALLKMFTFGFGLVWWAWDLI